MIMRVSIIVMLACIFLVVGCSQETNIVQPTPTLSETPPNTKECINDYAVVIKSYTEAGASYAAIAEVNGYHVILHNLGRQYPGGESEGSMPSVGQKIKILGTLYHEPYTDYQYTYYMGNDTRKLRRFEPAKYLGNDPCSALLDSYEDAFFRVEKKAANRYPQDVFTDYRFISGVGMTNPDLIPISVRNISVQTPMPVNLTPLPHGLYTQMSSGMPDTDTITHVIMLYDLPNTFDVSTLIPFDLHTVSEGFYNYSYSGDSRYNQFSGKIFEFPYQGKKAVILFAKYSPRASYSFNWSTTKYDGYHGYGYFKLPE